jgi:pyruvate dehydrogenase E2 component (dihydrolipoamide acetyltransferase)
MATEIVMPRMGMTMEEGTIVNWLRGENQEVIAGEPLFEIETDKTTVEIEAREDGILGSILVKVGETVSVGTVVGYLVRQEEKPPISKAEDSFSDDQNKFTAASETSRPANSKADIAVKVKASPAARHLARKLDVDLADVVGTGPGGRVVAWNVTEAATAKPTIAAPRISPLASRVAEDLQIDLSQVKGSGPGGRITRSDVERSRTETLNPPAESAIAPISRQQKLMAERMVTSFREAPHFYLHVDVDARGLVALRQNLKSKFESKFGCHLTLTDLLIKFSAIILTHHPRLLIQWTDQGLHQAQNIHIGVAMDTPNGLVVPVIKNVDRLSLVDVARQRADLTARARNTKLLPQELEMGVFTITNLGMFRIDSFDAILNPPQAAILAVGRIKERALASGGKLIPAPMMKLTLSVDHRVLDGATAARFLSDLVELFEDPQLVLAY